VILFFITILYASGLKNYDIRTLLYCLSLTFPILVASLLLASIPKINYTQLSPEGIQTTIIGFIHRTVHWSDIGRVGKARIGSVDGLGIEYEPSFTRVNWMIRRRRKLFGWDELVSNAYSPDGLSLVNDVTKELKLHSKLVKH